MQHAKMMDIVRAVVANGFKVVDDHSPNGSLESLAAVGYHYRGERMHVVALYENTPYFSINEVYIDEETGKPHLSRTSVGGVIKPQGDLEAGIEQYNESQKAYRSNNPAYIGEVFRAEEGEAA